MKKTVFSCADILLPEFKYDDKRWQGWSVIACDQFTSEPEYWANAEKLAGEISTLSLILPEAYLESEKQSSHERRVAEEMKVISDKLSCHKDCMIYLERTLPDGKLRRGIVGKLDLNAYDYSKGSETPARATEATVVERIPPREAIRRAASCELPHTMLLVDDNDSIFDWLSAQKDKLTKVYDFELMLGGGRACGYKVSGEVLEALTDKIAEYEASRAGGVVYAIGDGNHSLAAAKSHYENIKNTVSDPDDHPARYSLCEIVSIHEDALVFEPIYRVVFAENPDEFLSELGKITKEGSEGQSVTVITAEGERTVEFTSPTHALTVGTLQNFIDEYMEKHPGVVCDYIHDESSLRALANKQGSVGFIFDGMSKSELFPYVCEHGALPRKTFSMGEAKSKRYYNEARMIIK